MEQHAPQQKGRQGFAAMNPETRRRIASLGGKAAHRAGTAHQWDPTEAQQAGRKGGHAVSRDSAHMAEIGRKGGTTRQQRQRERRGATV